MLKLIRIATLIAATGIGFNANAGTVSYLATEAVPDSLARYGGGHSLWIPGTGVDSSWLFANDSGLFTYDDMAGSATLTGSLFNEGNSILTGNINFNFSESASSDAIPKKELLSSAYTDGGGTIDTGLWTYFDTVSGSFTGTGNLVGLELEFWQRPTPKANGPEYKGQMGVGANGKNGNLGYSSWFYWTVLSACNNTDCGISLADGDKYHGDINIDLSPVPLPAAFWLFGSALLGLISMKRKAGQSSTA